MSRINRITNDKIKEELQIELSLQPLEDKKVKMVWAPSESER